MRIYVTPRPDHQIRDPLNPAAGYLPPEGAFKDDSQAWRRLERSGDVTIGKGLAKAGAAKHAQG